MHRPIRTRRLSIAAMISCAAFLVVACAGIRSFWITDELDFGQHRAVGLIGGCAVYVYAGYRLTQDQVRYQSGQYRRPPGLAIWSEERVVLGRNRNEFRVWVPAWFPLLLLLIIPVRWQIARPANAPAFPVIADPK